MAERGEVDLSGTRILVAEDEYLISRDLQRILQSAGSREVHLSARLADGLALCDRQRFDVGLLDLWLGDGQACPLADRLLADGAAVVFVTGYEDNDLPDRLSHLPALAKPFAKRRLLRTVQAAIAERT
jgi:DNA-binding NtrC family response regulator